MATIDDEAVDGDVEAKIQSCETPVMPSKYSNNSAMLCKTFPKRTQQISSYSDQVAAKLSHQQSSTTVKTMPVTQQKVSNFGFSPLQNWQKEAKKLQQSPADLTASGRKHIISSQQQSLPMVPTATAFKSIATTSAKPIHGFSQQDDSQPKGNNHQCGNAIIPPKKEGDQGLELWSLEDPSPCAGANPESTVTTFTQQTAKQLQPTDLIVQEHAQEDISLPFIYAKQAQTFIEPKKLGCNQVLV